MEKYFRKFALAIFLDKSGNTVIQDRRKYSKEGEKFGLYGGGIEQGETSGQAICRELKEELNLSVTNPKLWREIEISVPGHGLGYFAVFIFPLNDIVKSSIDIEGEKYYSTVSELSKSDIFDNIDKGFFKLILEDWDNILNNYLQ